MNIKTNVKKKFYDFVVESKDGKKFAIRVEAESETAARMLIAEQYRIVDPKELI